MAFTNDKAVAFIKEAEGCILHAYPDPATRGPPWTIGYGNTTYADGSPVGQNDTITQEQADELLLNLLANKYLPSMEQVPNWGSMTQSQQAALLSFSWNNGPGWYNSRVFKKLRALLDYMQWEQVAPEFYGFLGGPAVTGSVKDQLRSRRVAEGFMWYGAKIKIYNAWDYDPIPVVDDIDTTAPPPPTVLPWPDGQIGSFSEVTYDIDDYRTIPDSMINSVRKDKLPHTWA